MQRHSFREEQVKFPDNSAHRSRGKLYGVISQQNNRYFHCREAGIFLPNLPDGIHRMRIVLNRTYAFWSSASAF